MTAALARTDTDRRHDRATRASESRYVYTLTARGTNLQGCDNPGKLRLGAHRLALESVDYVEVSGPCLGRHGYGTVPAITVQGDDLPPARMRELGTCGVVSGMAGTYGSGKTR